MVAVLPLAGKLGIGRDAFGIVGQRRGRIPSMASKHFAKRRIGVFRLLGEQPSILALVWHVLLANGLANVGEGAGT
jgi:hypothetical protein